jgi:ATP/maltotriose-dependent transcriptional regulator MalT
MLGGLGWSFWFSGRADEGWRWFVTALALPGTSDPATRAGAAMWACYVGYAAGTGMDLSLAYGEEAVELARESGQPRLLAEATMLLAGANVGAGNAERAAELFDESHLTFADRDDDWSQALSVNARGRAASLRGDLDTAERLMTESMRHFDAAGVEWAKALVNDDIAILAEARGDIQTAIAGIEGARQAAIDLDLGGAEAMCTARLGNYALIQGDVERADALHAEALALAEAVAFPRCVAFSCNGHAMTRRVQGRLDEASEWAERVRLLCHQNRDLMGEALALASLGFVAERQGDLQLARQHHGEGLTLARRMNEHTSLALALEGLAGVAAAGGEGSAAATLLGCAHALRATKGGAPAGPASDVDRITAASVALVGDREFATAFRRGEATPYPELVEA